MWTERPSVSAHSLYKWEKAVKPDRSDQHAADFVEAKSDSLKLRAQLRCTDEEREILKRSLGALPWTQSKVPVYQRSSP